MQGVAGFEYEIVGNIRSGGSSEVKVGRCKKTGNYVAIKIIEKAPTQREDLGQAEILKLVDHPNIISLHDYYDTTTHLYLVMELARGGDIIDRLAKIQHYTETTAAKTARQILLALSHCHKRGIVHCDLKCDNILLATPDEDATVKIADFGFAQLVPRSTKLSEPCGTPEYVAPEVLEGQYDCSADMWSFGVILFILLSGELPWRGLKALTDKAEYRKALYAKIRRADYSFASDKWDGISVEAKDLIGALLQVDPAKRPNAQACLANAWVAGSCADDKNLLTGVLDEIGAFNQRRGQYAAAEHCLSSVLMRAGPVSTIVGLAFNGSTPQHRDILCERGVQPLISLAYSSDVADHLQAGQLIANRASQPAQRKVLLDAGVLRALVSLTSSPAEVLFFVGLALSHLCAEAEGRRQIAAADGIVPALSQMLCHAKSLVRDQAGRVVASLCLADQNHALLLGPTGRSAAGAQILSAIVGLARSELTELQKLALQALCALAENVGLHDALVEDQKLIALIDSTSRSTKLIGVHFSVALLYNLLSQNVRHTAECVRTGLDGLMILVQHKMKPVRDHATKALARLAHAQPDLMATSANPLARSMALTIKQKIGGQSASAAASPICASPVAVDGGSTASKKRTRSGDVEAGGRSVPRRPS